MNPFATWLLTLSITTSRPRIFLLVLGVFCSTALVGQDTLRSKDHFEFSYPPQWHKIADEDLAVVLHAFQKTDPTPPVKVLAIFNHNTNLTPIGYPFLILATQDRKDNNLAPADSSYPSILTQDLADFLKAEHAEKVQDFTVAPPVYDKEREVWYLLSSMKAGAHGTVYSIRGVKLGKEKAVILSLQVTNYERDQHFAELRNLLGAIRFEEGFE